MYENLSEESEDMYTNYLHARFPGIKRITTPQDKAVLVMMSGKRFKGVASYGRRIKEELEKILGIKYSEFKKETTLLLTIVKGKRIIGDYGEGLKEVYIKTSFYMMKEVKSQSNKELLNDIVERFNYEVSSYENLINAKLGERLCSGALNINGNRIFFEMKVSKIIEL